VAEACAVRTLTQPAHRPCSLVALRPPLRVCEPFFKISSWPSAAAETSRELQSADDRPTRCDCELVDHKSCAHRLGSLGCQPGPSKPELEVRLPSTNRRGRVPPRCSGVWATLLLPLIFFRTDTIRYSHCREGVSCAAVLSGKTAPPVPGLTRVGGGAINYNSYKAVTLNESYGVRGGGRATRDGGRQMRSAQIGTQS
jgi:hypothetical protein